MYGEQIEEDILHLCVVCFQILFVSLQCSTERRHDPLTIMDGMGRIVSIRSGRDWSDWSAELRFDHYLTHLLFPFQSQVA